MLCSHVPAILDAQSDAFANVVLHDPAYQRKVQYYSKMQRDITTRFTSFVETVPGSPSEKENGDLRAQKAEEKETRDLRDDAIFVLLMLAAIIVGLPAALDIVKDLLGIGSTDKNDFPPEHWRKGRSTTGTCSSKGSKKKRA